MQSVKFLVTHYLHLVLAPLFATDSKQKMYVAAKMKGCYFPCERFIIFSNVDVQRNAKADAFVRIVTCAPEPMAVLAVIGH